MRSFELNTQSDILRYDKFDKFKTHTHSHIYKYSRFF